MAAWVREALELADDGCGLEALVVLEILLNESTGELLAVDAEGDGSFVSEGDRVYQDANRDGYPDFTLSQTNPTAGLECRFSHTSVTKARIPTSS